MGGSRCRWLTARADYGMVVPMNGKRPRRDWQASCLLDALMKDRGWFPIHIEQESCTTGHPMRNVSRRSVYRVLNEGYVPTSPIQFEIAAVFGLLPSQIWGSAPLPDDYRHLTDIKVMAA